MLVVGIKCLLFVLVVRWEFDFRNKIEKKPLLKIHCDLWGPAPVESSQHMKYYVIFVDDHSRYTWIYPLKKKSEFFEVFLKFQKMVEK